MLRPLVPEDAVLQIIATLCCAYISFFLESVFKISGVLCCCGAGVVLAWLAPPIILNHESMHNFWGVLEWLGNTLIFLLAGLIFSTHSLSSAKAIDWLYVFVLYVMLNIIRTIVIFVCYPVLKRIGLKCSLNDAIFMGK